MPLSRDDDARPGDDEFLALQHEHFVVFHRGYRGQARPTRASPLERWCRRA